MRQNAAGSLSHCNCWIFFIVVFSQCFHRFSVETCQAHFDYISKHARLVTNRFRLNGDKYITFATRLKYIAGRLSLDTGSVQALNQNTRRKTMFKKSVITTGIGLFLLLNHVSSMAVEAQALDVKKHMVNGYEMAYVEKGSGKPVIFVHGSLSDYRTWLPMLDDFSESSRAISVSLRHFYPEQWDGKGDDISLQQHADDIAAFIKGLKLENAVVIGHSRGAAVAMLMASQHPQLASKLILADPMLITSINPGDAELQDAEKVRRSLSDNVMKYFNAGDADGGLQAFVDYVGGKGTWEKAPDNTRQLLRENAWTLTSMPRDLDTAFTCSNAGAIDVPVLLVTGDRSPARYRSMHSALQNCLPESSQVTIADSGHMMIRSNPTEFAFETQYFITGE
jgi:esterase